MKFQGFIGPAYILDSVNVDAQRCVNLYLEAIESGTGKGAQPAYLKSTPGLVGLATIGAGPIRCVHVDAQGRIFVVSGNTVYKVTYNGTAWSSSSIGTLLTSSGLVKAASATINDGATVFVDGTTCYLFWAYPTDVEDFGKFADFGYPGVSGATDIAFIDGYFIFIDGTNQFYVSDWASFNVDPLSFASAEGDPDDILACISNHRDLWLLGERTTEFFINTGNADFPFERVQGGFIETGCAARGSVAKVGGVVLWLGRNAFGQGIVYMASGATPQRVSTHAIEQAISGYADVSAATAYTYQKNGHSFYVLNFAEATWVYDIAVGTWHERAYTNSGTLERHRADFLAYYPDYDMHLLGDYSTGRLYRFDEDTYSDDGATITRLRTMPHVSSGLRRLFCSLFQIDMETGVGIDGSGQGSDPQIMLDYSDDGGHTWSSELWRSIGALGSYKTRVIWRRLGSFRDRVFRVKVTDPVNVTLIDAEIEIQGGNS